MSANQSLHRSPNAPVTRLASATRAPAAGAGELSRSATPGARMRSVIAVAVSLLASALGHAQSLPPGPSPGTHESSIGFRSAADALTALKAKPAVEILERDG
jgi:hypothetical protein